MKGPLTLKKHSSFFELHHRLIFLSFELLFQSAVFVVSHDERIVEAIGFMRGLRNLAFGPKV